MSPSKDLLILGFEPTTIKQMAPGTTIESIRNGLNSTVSALEAKSITSQIGWLDAMSVDKCVADTKEILQATEFRVIIIGAGIRALPEYFFFFENIINVVHELAPKSKIGFNQGPASTLEAAERWL